MDWNEKKVLVNIRQADTGDLLDRVTAYRAGMEPEAIDIVEQELRRRGVTAAQIAEHRETCERECLYYDDGTARMCSLCRKPAVSEEWGWFRLFFVIPLIPRRVCYCKEHGATT